MDENKKIYLFQEFASLGNAIDYVRAGNIVSEEQMCRWAQNIFAAMDYLGSMAIAHCGIYPKHFMLTNGNDGQILAKLSGFRDAIIYWNPNTNTVIPQPCKPLVEACSFHAPEMFGALDDSEYYDPVDADIWSYGTSMFFLIARVYPFRVNDPNLEGVVRNSIAELQITDPAKYWLFGLMRTNTAERTNFDAIDKDLWFSSV